MKKLIEDFLAANSPGAEKLKQRKAIAIGFVDGHLELIWAPNDENK